MGSLVAPDRLRFDYAASAPLTPEQIAEIERLVNEQILRDVEVTKQFMSMEDSQTAAPLPSLARNTADRVRVVDVPASPRNCAGAVTSRARARSAPSRSSRTRGSRRVCGGSRL